MTTALATQIGAAIHVFDDVLPNPHAYRAMALAQPFGNVPVGEQVFRGIAVAPDDTLPQIIRAAWRTDARTTLSFFRQSPQDQPAPTFIHSDGEMGEWTAILYLNPAPPVGDGTSFWRDRATDQIAGPFDAEAAAHWPRWACWRHVDAQFGRLVVFQSDLYHSRGLVDNYGAGDDARLVQVAFGRLGLSATVVREATERDVPAIVDMADRFVASTSYQGFIALDRACVSGLASRLIAAHDAVVLVAEQGTTPVGMLAMHAFEHPMSGERVASELVWWMEPSARGAGVRLLRAAEGWARDQGAAIVTMVAPTAEVGSLYARLGYAPVEVSWQRRI